MIISRDVTFHEDKLPYKMNVENQKSNIDELLEDECDKYKVVVADTHEVGIEFEELDEADNAPVQKHGDDNRDLSYYMLGRDRIRREIVPPKRYAHIQ